VVASSLAKTEDKAAESIAKSANIRTENPGSDRYQQNHMALIFQQGLSFSGFERNKVFIGQEGMRYVDLSDTSGADSDGDCRASVVADFDDDGDPDLFVNAIQREQHMLYRNNAGVSTLNGFVKVRLRATGGHPDAIGAIVKLRRDDSVQAQALSCGSGFESQNAPELIFGLGEAMEADISVLWPGRKTEDFGVVKRGLKTGGRYLLVEGTGEPESYAARTFQFKTLLPRGLRIRLGEKLESLSLKALDGSERTVKTGGDKPVLLNFWATTCTSCIAELPLLNKLHESGKYRVVGVSLDPEGLSDAVRKLWSKGRFTFDTFMISDTLADKLFDLPRLSIPLSIVVATDGRVERVLRGRIREGEL